MTVRAPDDAPISSADLDLMLYADGELEGEHLAAVEARLERDPAARTKLKALGLVSGMVRERALGGASAVDLTDAIMGAIEEAPTGPQPARKASSRERKAANDNARSFYLVVAAVVAAAATLLIWTRPTTAPGPGPVAQQTAIAPAPAPPKHGPVPEVEGDLEHGVEVSSIDFGENTGAVFYVPNSTSPSDTTTVVWLADASGEDE